MEDSGGKAIDKVGRSREGIGPVLLRNRRLMEQRESGLDDMTMFAFGNPIILRCVWWGGEVRDAVVGEERPKSNELASVVREQSSNLALKTIFDKRLEGNESGLDI